MAMTGSVWQAITAAGFDPTAKMQEWSKTEQDDQVEELQATFHGLVDSATCLRVLREHKFNFDAAYEALFDYAEYIDVEKPGEKGKAPLDGPDSDLREVRKELREVSAEINALHGRPAGSAHPGDLDTLRRRQEELTARVALLEGHPPPAAAAASRPPPDGLPPVVLTCPERVDLGDEVKVVWTTSRRTTTSDWIGMFHVGAGPKQQIDWAYVGGTVGSGHVRLRCPTTPCEVEFRFCPNKSYDPVAVSAPVPVGPVFFMEAARSSSVPNQVVVSFFRQFGAPCPKAWIGLYDREDAPDGEYITYQWCSDAMQVIFTCPKASGTYYFRLFPLNARPFAAAARTFIAMSGEDHLSIFNRDGRTIVHVDLRTRDPNAERVWIGVYRVEEKNHGRFRRWQWVRTVGASEADFKTPIHRGVYHARLFCSASDEPLLVSAEQITVEEKAGGGDVGRLATSLEAAQV